MMFSASVILATLASLASAAPDDHAAAGKKLVTREDCDAGQCVIFFSGVDCTGELGNFKPDCTGACFRFYQFASITTEGTRVPIAGTACKIFSDPDCQFERLDIPDQIEFREA
ncbi:hypothetical protein ACJ41O_011888 [Fusarium nematophilum]